MNERPIPEAAYRDRDSVEMLRVWIAEQKLQCSMKIGMYEETTDISEEKAWGTILADVARHIAKALEAGYAKDQTDALCQIRNQFFVELGDPTSDIEGGFIKPH